MLHASEHLYSPQLKQPRHAHEETTITVILAGTLREVVGRREEIARPLSFVLKPRGTEHANVFGDTPVRTLRIAVPVGEVSALESCETSFRSWCWQHGGAAVHTFLMLLAVLRRERRALNSGDEVQRAIADVLAATAAAPEPARGTPPRWIALVRERLDDERDAVSVAQLARSAGVHRVYLARQFRRWFGCTITSHVQRRRVQRAAELIAGGRASLSPISYDAGFADQAHLSRVFRRETGVTPGAFRRLISGTQRGQA